MSGRRTRATKSVQELSATCRRDRFPAWARGMRNTYNPPAPRERTSEMRASDVGLVRGACGVAALLRLLRWSCVSLVCVSACLGVVRVAAQKRDKYTRYCICIATTRYGNEGHTHTLLRSEEMAKAIHVQVYHKERGVARADSCPVRCEQAAWLLNKADACGLRRWVEHLHWAWVATTQLRRTGADPHSAAFQGRYGFLF